MIRVERRPIDSAQKSAYRYSENSAEPKYFENRRLLGAGAKYLENRRRRQSI